jgi:NAD(P)-dependent dehydrogenase (short-subunit alcohol dehydrogenase family)
LQEDRLSKQNLKSDMQYAYTEATLLAQPGKWVLILGASSGFGAATAREFARAGYHVAGVHLDRRATMPAVEELIQEISALGVETRFFNINAADAEKRHAMLAELSGVLAKRNEMGQLRALVHSLAFGALRPFIGEAVDTITPQHMDMTLEVMANSLVYWTQDIVNRELMGEGGRIFAMTSAGGHRAWPSYGAVSAAKAVLEAHIRQLALELAPFGITANAIQAGVTDTPALRKIPGNQRMMRHATQSNPHGRLTLPEDVAQAIVALSVPGTAWITGNVIRVDGGEDIIG